MVGVAPGNRETAPVRQDARRMPNGWKGTRGRPRTIVLRRSRWVAPTSALALVA